jgi:hypothetical protein
MESWMTDTGIEFPSTACSIRTQRDRKHERQETAGKRLMEWTRRKESEENKVQKKEAQDERW